VLEPVTLAVSYTEVPSGNGWPNGIGASVEVNNAVVTDELRGIRGDVSPETVTC